MVKKRKKLWIISGAIILVIFGSLIFLLRRPAGAVNGDQIEWGTAFSKYFSEKMGLDWRETYLAILDDLKPKILRLPVYWEDVEPQSNTYNFADYDWMVQQAQKKNVKLILVIGRKLPRWPECHIPGWAAPLNAESQQTRIFKLLPEIVDRYKNLSNLYLWQVENEPFLSFGDCPLWGGDFLDKEIATVRAADPKHQIMITDSGELSFWLPAASRADIFGTTIYRVVWNSWLGYYKYPLPPQFFWLKANLVHLFNPDKPIVVSELQGETWGHRMPYETELTEQFKSIDLGQFNENIAYARRTGFPQVYIWGAEWWYWLKTKQNHPEFWAAAKAVINSN